MKKHLKKSIPVAALLLLVGAGCAKKRDYKEVFKAEVQEKNTAFDPTAEYVYVPSMLEAPMTSDATRPGFLGTERLVKFRFTEKAIVAETVETDDRFKDNPANAKPVIEIPVQHLDYRCADNGNGECSNREEVVDDKDWETKRYFRPDLDSMKIQETNTLPMELENLFENCQSEIGSRVVSSTFENDAVNIILEKTFRVSGDCIELHSLEEVPDAATFNVRYSYSFVRRDAVATKDYQKVYYPQTDENTFGFFKTELHQLSNDNRDQADGVLPLMNRWNPNRKTLTYHLSANFAKPEYKRVLDATKESVAAVNTGLKTAGVGFQIDLQPPSDVSAGDARNSMILMVEDPQATGIIGYGPAVSDPRTGEIISARVVMYLGSMKKFIRVTWDEFAAAEAAKTAAAKAAASLPSTGAEPNSQKDVVARMASAGSLVEKVDGAKTSHEDAISHLFKSYAEHRAAYPSDLRTDREVRGFGGGISQVLGTKNFQEWKRQQMTQRDSTLVDAKAARSFADDDATSKQTFLARRTELLAKYAYPADYLNATGAIKNATLKELKSIPMVKWVDLTEDQQNQVLDAILPYMWVSTLVHELGHNMGLRHNFAGSEDKDNYYTKEELKKLGQENDDDRPVIYSSVMDYSNSELNFLHVMGKYDVAALRFGYRREVESKSGDGTFDKVAGSLEEMNAKTKGAFTSSMKNFQYCTDENTGINPNCRRFDEGTTLTEIAQNLQKSYAERYWRANFRNGRRDFSENTDSAYASAVDDLLSDMRPFFESYDRIWKLFGGDPEKDPEYNTPDAADFRKYYTDLKSAVSVIRDIYVKTILTPGAGCFVQFVDGDNKGKVLGVTAKQLGGTFQSCFEPRLMAIFAANQAVPLAQFGKNFQNEKAKDNPNPYADQIDTRGIWTDKLLAVDYLVQRRLGVKTFDDYRGNFLDMTSFSTPVLKDGKPVLDKAGKPQLEQHRFDEKMVEIVDGFLMNDLTLGKKGRVAEEGFPELDLTLSDGSTTSLKNQEYNFFPHSLHWIPYQQKSGLRRAFWLPKDDETFGEAMLSRVLAKMPDTTANVSATAIRDYYGVKSVLATSDNPKDYTSYDLGDSKVFALKGKNTFVENLVARIGIVKTLSAVKDDRIDAVLAAIKAGKTDGLSDAEKAAAKIPSDVIATYKAGKFDDVDYYELVLRMVVRANQRAVDHAVSL